MYYRTCHRERNTSVKSDNKCGKYFAPNFLKNSLVISHAIAPNCCIKMYDQFWKNKFSSITLESNLFNKTGAIQDLCQLVAYTNYVFSFIHTKSLNGTHHFQVIMRATESDPPERLIQSCVNYICIIRQSTITTQVTYMFMIL